MRISLGAFAHQVRIDLLSICRNCIYSEAAFEDTFGSISSKFPNILWLNFLFPIPLRLFHKIYLLLIVPCRLLRKIDRMDAKIPPRPIGHPSKGELDAAIFVHWFIATINGGNLQVVRVQFPS